MLDVKSLDNIGEGVQTSKECKTLMPCIPSSKARKLLKTNKAKAIKREPYTIQLIHEFSSYKQEITLGVDTGSKIIGLSVTKVTTELFSAELELRKNITELLSITRQYRSTRRNRKTR